MVQTTFPTGTTRKLLMRKTTIDFSCPELDPSSRRLRTRKVLHLTRTLHDLRSGVPWQYRSKALRLVGTRRLPSCRPKERLRLGRSQVGKEFGNEGPYIHILSYYGDGWLSPSRPTRTSSIRVLLPGHDRCHWLVALAQGHLPAIAHKLQKLPR